MFNNVLSGPAALTGSTVLLSVFPPDAEPAAENPSLPDTTFTQTGLLGL